MNVQIIHRTEGRYVTYEDYYAQMESLTDSINKLQAEVESYKPNVNSSFIIKYQHTPVRSLNNEAYAGDYATLIAKLQELNHSSNISSIRVFALHELPVVTQSITVKLPE
jgi:hypothetical protein